ncbi:AraC family transcriptional regulator [Maribacter sp. 2308TA10-17]|uniref:AraC family transcriptional regulator n=1 Tax=Maribacter sp. 2308TA10-17 TaxID=3386276 RepID=UPI0039BC233A
MKRNETVVNKPTFESIEPSFGNSFAYQKFDKNQRNQSNVWHYHPEIELVFVNGGSGKRQIGSNLSYYTNGTLILIGSNLPHCGFTDELTGNRSETVVQMKKDFLGENFFTLPEMEDIENLFEIAKSGVVFYGETKAILGHKLETLENKNSFERLHTILDVLYGLSTTDEFRILNAEGFSMHTGVKDNDRINIVFNFVKTNFKEEIKLQEIADVVSMTVPSFCRYFKKITNKTFTQFVNEYRLVHASKLLSEQQLSITEVCFESGFNNFSYFNKSFKKFTGQSPSKYRNELKQVIT